MDSIGLLNYDSSFFSVHTPDILPKTPLLSDISKRIISFEITEELGKMPHGSLSMYDEDNDIYAYEFGLGKKLTIKWGYKDQDVSGQKIYAKKENQRELFAPGIISRYMEAMIKDPSGSGNSNGTKIYNCNFISYDTGGWKRKIFNSRGMTKGSVVRQVFADMKITNVIINFRMQNNPVYGNTAIRQDNVSNFRFLVIKSMEWRSIFRISYDSKNQPVGLFCDYDADKSIETFFTLTMGTIGDSCLLEWKKGQANIKSFTWSHNEGANGSGDNVQIQMINGQPQFYRFKATTKGVVVYKLNVAKIKSEFQELGTSPGAIISHMNKLLEMSTMDELIANKYYIPSTTTTAPQGIGFTVNVEAIGNPFCTAPARIKFGAGFPDLLKVKGLTFYVQSVTHKIDTSGYSMSLKIVDSFSASGGTYVG
jgi:hypothetical protein